MKAIGFFTKSESDEALALRIIAASQDSYYGNILKLKDNPSFIPILASYDKSKVWFVEDWMILGSTTEFKSNFYLEVLRKLEKISDGHFAPKNIEIEHCGYCAGRDKRLRITFNLKQEAVTLISCTDIDVLILSFLAEINEILDPIGFSFQVIKDNYGPCFTFFLTHDQRNWFENRLQENFESHSINWLDRAIFARDSGKKHEAKEYFEKSILGKFNPFAISEYGALLEDLNKPETALQIYRLGIKNLENFKGEKDWWRNAFQEKVNLLK
ncbi:MAG: hypothetical protein GY810_16890 [Aureispira sp.]|nr:hypothetical protein [Aureispira sp.]